jgi:hypothetical protein
MNRATIMARQQTAAMRDFDPALDRCGSIVRISPPTGSVIFTAGMLRNQTQIQPIGASPRTVEMCQSQIASR